MNDLDKVVTAASPILMLTTILIFAIFIFLIIGYILIGISLYKINKNSGKKGSWMAWVPIFNVYLLGKLGFHKIAGIFCSIATILCTSFTISVNGVVKESFSFFPPIVSNIVLFIVGILMIISAARLYKNAGKKISVFLIVSILTLGIAIPFFLFSIRNINNQVEMTPVNNHNPVNVLPSEPTTPDVTEPINSIWQDKKVEEVSPLPLPEMNIENEPVINEVTPISAITEEIKPVVQPLPNAVPVQPTTTPLPTNPLPVSQSVSNPMNFGQLPSNEPNTLLNNTPKTTPLIHSTEQSTNSFLEEKPKVENQQPKQFMSVEELLNSQNFK